MKNFIPDLLSWLFCQRGFTWSEWRELCRSVRNDPGMPENWTGEW